MAKISEKGHEFLLGRMYYIGDVVYQNVLAFSPILSTLILDSNKIVTNWISTGRLPEEII